MSLVQVAFRGRNDDGSEALASWIDNINADWSQAVSQNFRIRFQVSGDEDDAGPTPRLQYQHNSSGTWTNVNTSLGGKFYVLTAASTHYVDGADCTEQMAGGLDFVDNNNGMDDNNAIAGPCAFFGPPPPALPLAFAEFEYCVTIVSADVNNGDELQFRLINGTGAHPFDSYVNIPVVTVVKPVPTQVWIQDEPSIRAEMGMVGYDG